MPFWLSADDISLIAGPQFARLGLIQILNNILYSTTYAYLSKTDVVPTTTKNLK